MTFQDRCAQFLAVLSRTGIQTSIYRPPLFQILWRMGVEIPPPHFISFILNMLINGVFFGALWGVFMWNFFWSSKGKAGIDAIEISASAGLTFGIIMAVQYEFGKRKYKLPSWKSFGEN